MARFTVVFGVTLVCALLCALVNNPAHAESIDPVLEIYRVKNIKIEHNSDDLEMAKMQAIDDGKAVAFTELMKRFQSYGYIDNAAKASFETVEDAIKDVDVIEELVTETSYEARVNYRFEPMKILKFLGVERVGFLPKKDRYVLIPVYIEKGEQKPWHSQWAAAWKQFVRSPITLASGDLEDMKAVNATDLAQQIYTGVDKTAHKYRAPVILIAEAEYDTPKNILHVRLKRFEADAELVAEYQYPGVFGIGSKELLVTAASDVMNKMATNGVPRTGKALVRIEEEEEFDVDYERNYQSEKSEDQKLMRASVVTRSLSDWSAIRRKLINTKLINNLNVASFLEGEVTIKIYHIGEVDELRRSLAGNGLSLVEMDGKIVIDRVK